MADVLAMARGTSGWAARRGAAVNTLRELLDAVLAIRRDLRRLALASAPTLSRSEVAELLGANEAAAGAWLDARERDILASTPGKERRYSGPRVRAALEMPEAKPRRTREEKADNVLRLRRPTTSA